MSFLGWLAFPNLDTQNTDFDQHVQQYFLHWTSTAISEIITSSWEILFQQEELISGIIISPLRPSHSGTTRPSAAVATPSITVSSDLTRALTRPDGSRTLTSAIITVSAGPEQRLFAAHEEVLCHSPYLASLCQQVFYDSSKKIELPEIDPQIFSCVLEYLYKGDYYPRLEFDKRRKSWLLQDAADAQARAGTVEITVYDQGMPVSVLKDSVIYVSLHL